jgi:DNA-binding CsgD family transcriptional regulator/predicted enzyme related to lactoylglutathione lyase
MTGARTRGRPPWPDILTPAEWRVAEAVRHGMSNRVIAERVGCTTDAVKFHVSNVLTKLALSRRAELRRWDGVRADALLAKRRMEMTGDVRLGTVGQVSRSVRDISEATAFYRDVLELPHLYTFGKLGFFDLAGMRLFLEEAEHPGPQSVLYFRVADIHGAAVRLEGRGAKFVSAPHLIHRHQDGTEEWMAFFEDPERRPLALMSQIVPGTVTAEQTGRD